MEMYLSGWQATNLEREKAVLDSGWLKWRCFSFASIYKIPGLPYYIPGAVKALELCEQSGVKIMMDSGVIGWRSFRANCEKKKDAKALAKLVDEKQFIELYVDYVKKNQHKWGFSITIDLERIAKNVFPRHQRILEMGIKPVPVFHGDDDAEYYLKKYKDLGHNFIAIGTTGERLRGNVKEFRHYLHHIFNIATKLDLELHGLAMTAPWMMVQYPWTAVDSLRGDTSFVVVRQAGRVRIDSMEELFWSTPGIIYLDSEGRSYKHTYDMEILSVDSDGEIEWKELSKVIRHRVYKKMARVQAVRGATVDVTLDHSLMTTRKEDFNPVPNTVAEMKEEDRLISAWELPSTEGLKELTVDIPHAVYSSKKKQFGGSTYSSRFLPVKVSLDEEFLEFIGLWLADGSYSRGISLSIGIDKECTDLVQRVCLRFKDKTYRIKIAKNGVDTGFSSSYLVNVMKALGLNGDSRSKQLPWWAFELNSSQRCALLRGYFSGDGSHPACCSSSSDKLFYGMLLLLQSEGIRASQVPNYRLTRSRGGFSNDDLPRTGGGIFVTSVNDVKLYAQKIGFLQKRKNDACADWLTKPRSKKKNKKGFQIASCFLSLPFKIKYYQNYKGWVYDVSVPDGESFLANGLLVHNSSSWSRVAGFGGIMMFDENKHRLTNVNISKEATKTQNMQKLNSKIMEKLKEEVALDGFDFEQLRDDFVQRHIYNARTMYRMADYATKRHDSGTHKKVNLMTFKPEFSHA